ncbi:MAG: hypothetical protein DRO23_10740 [Thermoprotei archaeon]|nr:MAG: hypothetical protein DRO23_10740 [Thermoprotei archaeon]
MKVLILAFDGLEHDLVIKWRLRNIMQVKYGKYPAPKSPKHGKPHTPSAWISFITGKDANVHGIDDWWTYGKILDWVRYKPPFIWIKNKRKILWRLGLRPKPRLYNKKDLKYSTVFEVIKPSIPLFIPGYNEPSEIHYELNRALEKGISTYEKAIWKIYEYRVKVLFESLNKEWRLLMCWFGIADLMGHIHMCRPWKLMKAYFALDRLAKEIRASIDKDVFLLIVSDHGMKLMSDGTGDHSESGFYSISKPIEWFKPKKITDFYNLILKLVKT